MGINNTGVAIWNKLHNIESLHPPSAFECRHYEKPLQVKLIEVIIPSFLVIFLANMYSINSSHELHTTIPVSARPCSPSLQE